MDFDLQNVKQLTKGINLIFAKITKKPEKSYLDIATEIETKNHSVDYAWLGDLPIMRRWIDKRYFAKLKDYKYSLSKEDFEATFSVKRDDFLFDNLGLVKVKVSQLGDSLIKLKNRMTNGLIAANGTCFDGKKFFDEHEVGNNIYTNRGTAKLNKANLFAVIAYMDSICDTTGENAQVEASALLYAPDLTEKVKELIGSEKIGGSDNPAYNLVKTKKIRGMPAGSWCLIDNTQELKPFILQITKAGKEDVQEDTSDMFKEKLVHYGIDAMLTAGYGPWQFACFMDGTAAANAAVTTTGVIPSVKDAPVATPADNDGDGDSTNVDE